MEPSYTTPPGAKVSSSGRSALVKVFGLDNSAKIKALLS